MEIFKINNLTKRFTEDFVLNNFSLTVNEGDKINISGRSGIGKSTLFKLLLGFEPSDSGSIYFKNKKITEQNIWNIRRQIAYIPQDVNIGSGTVSSLFNETLNFKANLFLKNEQNQISGFISKFGFTNEILSKNIEELSGGEKQRVAIINGLILGRKIYLLDEITSALDAELKATVLNYFLKNNNFTVLYISHDDYLPENCNVRTINLNKK